MRQWSSQASIWIKEERRDKGMTRRAEELNYYRRLASRLFITAGSVLMTAVVIVNVMDYVKSRGAVTEFKEAKQAIITFETGVGDIDPGLSDAEDSASEVDLTSALGLMHIEKIEMQEAVKEGSTSGVLSSALGHVENTAQPGQTGNCVIAGHRNYVFGRFFNRLNEVEPGDIVEIETLDAVYSYTVTESFIVNPDEISVMDPMEGSNLTLITCTPLFVGSHRLIIRGVL